MVQENGSKLLMTSRNFVVVTGKDLAEGKYFAGKRGAFVRPTI
jgi:hypothetical protein